MEQGFTKTNSSNLPRVDLLMLGEFLASNKDFCSAEFRNVKTTISRQAQSASEFIVTFLKNFGATEVIKMAMEISFKGKKILVTGAGQGIGRGIAVELWRAGANIVALSRTRSHLESLQSEYPSIDIVDVDIGDWEKTRKVVESLGHFDALVNNAAVAVCEPFLDCTPSSFDKMMDVNVKAVLNISQIVARKMVENKTHGAIVNISSQASKAALKDHAIYSASKAALDALTRAMALELGPHGIRVNAVNPTVIMTEMGKIGWTDPAKANEMLSKIPLRRFGEVSEVVSAVVFLLSERSSMINGVELPIDGGFLAT